MLAAQPQMGRMAVLCVEDSAPDATYMKELLGEALGGAVDVTCVEDLGKALRYLRTFRPTVILLDLYLPDSSGLETVSQLHAVAPGLPIVVVSGADEESLLANAVEAGAQDYLLKGHIDQERLLHTIRFAIERQRIQNERFVSLEEAARLLNPRRLSSIEANVDSLLDRLGQPPDRDTD